MSLRRKLAVVAGGVGVTVLPATENSTPLGTGMGARPIRLMTDLPDVAEDFAADLALARLPVGHEPLAGGQDGDAEAAEDAGQPVGAG